MTEKGDPEPRLLRDRWLVLIILILAGVTIWNSRTVLWPDRFVATTPYSNFGFTFRHPQDADLWEIGLDEEDVFDYTGRIPPTEEGGMVGYSRESQEAAVTWTAKEEAPTLEEMLEIHYNSVVVNGERRGREVTITKGELETGETNGHATGLQLHTLELIMPDSSDPVYGEGYVAGWYCRDTGRVFLVYTYRWNTGSPPDQTEAQALNRINSFLNTMRCHG